MLDKDVCVLVNCQIPFLMNVCIKHDLECFLLNIITKNKHSMGKTRV
jgi:hypothetical protein